jgi:hypothetical protein
MNAPVIEDSTRYNTLDKIPRTNNYQGDARLFLDENGSYLKFRGGQPIMDQGLENMVNIKLFTRRGWAGNTLFPDPVNHIGSNFELSLEAPITLQSLNDTRNAALEALDDPAFGDIEVEVTNPESYRRDVLITIKPPGQDIIKFLVTKNGLNWTAQKLNPAYKKE